MLSFHIVRSPYQWLWCLFLHAVYAKTHTNSSHTYKNALNSPLAYGDNVHVPPIAANTHTHTHAHKHMRSQTKHDNFSHADPTKYNVPCICEASLPVLRLLLPKRCSRRTGSHTTTRNRTNKQKNTCILRMRAIPSVAGTTKIDTTNCIVYRTRLFDLYILQNACDFSTGLHLFKQSRSIIKIHPADMVARSHSH